jgi:hypothetical protein
VNGLVHSLQQPEQYAEDGYADNSSFFNRFEPEPKFFTAKILELGCVQKTRFFTKYVL